MLWDAHACAHGHHTSLRCCSHPAADRMPQMLKNLNEPHWLLVCTYSRIMLGIARAGKALHCRLALLLQLTCHFSVNAVTGVSGIIHINQLLQAVWRATRMI